MLPWRNWQRDALVMRRLRVRVPWGAPFDFIKKILYNICKDKGSGSNFETSLLPIKKLKQSLVYIGGQRSGSAAVSKTVVGGFKSHTPRQLNERRRWYVKS